MLPNNVKPRIAFTVRKVGISFQIKGKTEMKHNECPKEPCKKNYICETRRRINEKIIDHSGKNSKCYIYKHCIKLVIDLQISMVLKLSVVTFTKMYLNAK